MPSNIGNQTVTVKYFDPADSQVVNKIGLDVRKRGIYSGGYLTKISDTSVELSTLSCEIGDSSHQVRISTSSTITLTVSSTNRLVVLRWTYTGSTSDYMEILAINPSTVQDNDLIVGECSYSGSTLTGFDYTDRSNPDVSDLFLKVEPTSPASMRVRIRAGRVNYGDQNYDIIDQESPLLTAPVSGTRIDLIQVNSSGAIIVTQGTTSAPDYDGLVTLAEITLTAGMSSISASNIKDVRNFVSTSKTLTSILEAVYPVGSIYLNANNSTNPATLLGFGTWVAIEGECLVGFKSGDSDFGSIGSVAAGEKTHTLTKAELPPHVHTYSKGVYQNESDGLGGALKSLTTDNSGDGSADGLNGDPHNNIQPSYVVYMWRRIA